VGRLLEVATGPLLLVGAGPLLLAAAGPLLLVLDTAVAFGTGLPGAIGAVAGGPMVWGHAGAGRT